MDDTPPLGSKEQIDWSKRVESLLRYYIQYKDSSTTKFNRFDEQVVDMHDNVAELFNKDYHVQYIHNEDGQWCATYPLLLVIITAQKGKDPVNSKHLIKEALSKGARYARVRTRFVVPVILFRVFQTTANSIKDTIFVDDEDDAGISSKNAQQQSAYPPPLSSSRSAPLNGPQDVTMSFGIGDASSRRSISQSSGMLNMVSAGSGFIAGALSSTQANATFQSFEASTPPLDRPTLTSPLDKEPSLMDKYRNCDISLLNILRITHICDLMVENAKKMMGVTVCSSEKKDSHNRYSGFSLNVMPYPGVEFFKEFSSADPQKAASMYFDWSSTVDPATLSIVYSRLHLRWDDYKRWDLVTLTQNYLRLMLTMICDDSCTGLLVHCISGWDRTPMMISLLRLSLWADGEVHPTLSASEILYLTIAYDWMLYRHQLVHRQSRGEDIFFFCFYFLDFIKGKDFCVHDILHRLASDPSGSDTSHTATNLSSEAVLAHPRHEGTQRNGKNSKRNSAASKFGGSLDDLHRSTGSLASDLLFPMLPLRTSDSGDSTPRHDDVLAESDSSSEESNAASNAGTASRALTREGKTDVRYLSDEEYDSERLVLGDVEEAGSWQLVKERNFDTFMAEHLKNLPHVGTSPSPPKLATNFDEEGSNPISSSMHSRNPERHTGSAASSPGTSPTMGHARRSTEEDLKWKQEERKRKLELVRTEFMRMHETHILPETAKLRSSIWSSWFSGFSFK